MTPNPLSRADLRPLSVLIAALLAARLLFILLMPAVYSKDLYSWLHVMDVLQSGGNPYGQTEALNWPPFWMQILFGIHHFSRLSGTNPVYVIQAVLVFGEVLVLCTAYIFGRQWTTSKNLFRPLLLGLSLNPVSAFLSCQHCNYDVFVGLFILLGAGMLCLWCTQQKAEHWLAACFCVGVGILAKTVPVMLVPLLLTGIRRLPWSTRLLGAALVAAPFAIGMSVLFTLEPYGVMRNVIGYRSMGGWYGFSGIFWSLHIDSALPVYRAISPFMLLAALLFAGFKSLQTTITDGPGILLRAALLMIFVSTFGPGYTPPYILWYLPLLVLLFAVASISTPSVLSEAEGQSKRASLQRILFWGWLVTIGTYTVEYAFFDSHGAFIKAWWHLEKVSPICERLGSRQMQTLIRLPMFAMYLLTFFTLLRLSGKSVSRLLPVTTAPALPFVEKNEG